MVSHLHQVTYDNTLFVYEYNILYETKYYNKQFSYVCSVILKRLFFYIFVSLVVCVTLFFSHAHNRVYFCTSMSGTL